MDPCLRRGLRKFVEDLEQPNTTLPKMPAKAGIQPASIGVAVRILLLFVLPSPDRLSL